MSYRLLPGMSKYIKDFETERRNPHRITVRLYFRKSGVVVERPLRLTAAGNLLPADVARLLSAPAKEASSDDPAAGPSV